MMSGAVERYGPYLLAAFAAAATAVFASGSEPFPQAPAAGTMTFGVVVAGFTATQRNMLLGMGGARVLRFAGHTGYCQNVLRYLMVRNRALTGHLAGKIDGNYPIAVLGQETLGATQGRSRTVRLSKYTADKQAGRIPENPGHPDLAPEDYQRVQRIFDKGRMFRKGKRYVVGFIEEDGKLWAAVVKAAKDGRETYLTTFHRAQARDLRHAQKHFKELEGK